MHIMIIFFYVGVENRSDFIYRKLLLELLET
jgi:hypothetical protein